MTQMKNIRNICQIGIVCNDIEVARKNFATLFGMPVPATVDGGDYEITKCEYLGVPVMNGKCKMAFFDMDNIQIELIEPIGELTFWKEYLEHQGNGIHHIACQLDDIEEGICECEKAGLKLVQRGNFPDNDGKYAYLDGKEVIGCYLELLCPDKVSDNAAL